MILESDEGMVFRNRRDAGQRLARKLERFAAEAPLVVGLPRGGVPVAYEVARAIDAPLDIWVVRKLGAPMQPELAMGAIAEGGGRYLDANIVGLAGATAEEIAEIEEEASCELAARVLRFRKGAPPPDLRDQTVIVVDDGIATGATVRAAVRAMRKMSPARLILAAPVAAPETVAALEAEVDEIVCLSAPPRLGAIGFFYSDFSQTTDEDVLDLLEKRASEKRGQPAHASGQGKEGGEKMGHRAIDRAVKIATDGVELAGDLRVPEGATSLILFAHGSGSSRHSPRNRFVADVLHRAGIGTLLMDLLTTDEEERDQWGGRYRFDIGLLSSRLAGATAWVLEQAALKDLAIGYFGASTGAAAALVAAASEPKSIRAVVSRGGRPDLAMLELPRVEAPTLLIVGSADPEVLALNEEAYHCLRCPKHLAVVPGATHLFEEPGALEEVARLAAGWFRQHVGRQALRPTG